MGGGVIHESPIESIIVTCGEQIEHMYIHCISLCYEVSSMTEGDQAACAFENALIRHRVAVVHERCRVRLLDMELVPPKSDNQSLIFTNGRHFFFSWVNMLSYLFLFLYSAHLLCYIVF